jgi:hypothetical protein
LHTVPIADLRPTQITVGMREVRAKQKSWQQQDNKKKAEFLGRHMIPVIRRPKGRLYVIDHHHLSLALHNEGVENVHVTSVADLRNLADDEFWTYVDNRSWVHPYDTSGRRDFDEIPGRFQGSRTIPSAASPASYAATADSPRTPRRSASSCGRISCAAGSADQSPRTISRKPSSRP